MLRTTSSHKPIPNQRLIRQEQPNRTGKVNRSRAALLRTRAPALHPSNRSRAGPSLTRQFIDLGTRQASALAPAASLPDPRDEARPGPGLRRGLGYAGLRCGGGVRSRMSTGDVLAMAGRRTRSGDSCQLSTAGPTNAWQQWSAPDFPFGSTKAISGALPTSLPSRHERMLCSARCRHYCGGRPRTEGAGTQFGGLYRAVGSSPRVRRPARM